MAYEIELHYGFERSHDTYETYHAFEATDIEEDVDDAANPCALSCPRGRWSASERRAMQPEDLAYWPR